MTTEPDDELRFHLDMLERDLIAGGMDPAAARAEAARRFGSVEAVRAELAPIRRRRLDTAITLLAIVLVNVSHRLLWYLPAYASLHQHRPYYVAESLKSLFEIAVVIIALLVMGRRSVARELALDGRGRAALFALAATWPTVLGLAIAYHVQVTNWISVGYLAFFSPFAEELTMRGFAFRSFRRSGWGFWPAALACGLVTGIGHVEKGQTAGEVLALFVMLTLFGTIACWFIERWQSIWFPFALHALMNFWWEVFRVAPTALGGWYAVTLQNATIVMAILITLRFTPSPRERTGAMRREAPRSAPPAAMRMIVTAGR